MNASNVALSDIKMSHNAYYGFNPIRSILVQSINGLGVRTRLENQMSMTRPS